MPVFSTGWQNQQIQAVAIAVLVRLDVRLASGEVLLTLNLPGPTPPILLATVVTAILRIRGGIAALPYDVGLDILVHGVPPVATQRCTSGAAPEQGRRKRLRFLLPCFLPEFSGYALIQVETS